MSSLFQGIIIRHYYGLLLKNCVILLPIPVVNVNIVTQAIIPYFLLIHSFNHSLHKSVHSPIHNLHKQTNNQRHLHSIVKFLSNALHPFPSYVICVNFRSNHLCIYLCVIHVCSQSENQLAVYNIVSSLAPCSLHVK